MTKYARGEYEQVGPDFRGWRLLEPSGYTCDLETGEVMIVLYPGRGWERVPGKVIHPVPGLNLNHDGTPWNISGTAATSPPLTIAKSGRLGAQRRGELAAIRMAVGIGILTLVVWLVRSFWP